MDVENLDKGEPFKQLPDTCTICITEKDFSGEKAPIYQIQRMNMTTGTSFEDGAYILHVNGEYRGDSDVGKLMHDFNCTDASDMQIDLLAQWIRSLKETPEGANEMCKEMEMMRDKSRAEGEWAAKKEMAIAFQKRNMPVEFIAEIAKVSTDLVKRGLHRQPSNGAVPSMTYRLIRWHPMCISYRVLVFFEYCIFKMFIVHGLTRTSLNRVKTIGRSTGAM